LVLSGTKKERSGENYIMRSLMICRPTPYHLEKPSLDGRIILRWIIREWGLVAWTRLIWLRIGTFGRLLQTR